MAARYDVIANDRERLERTARNSIRTLSSLYADRAHFILELLQNAEDALRKRPHGWSGSKAIKFNLSQQTLRLSHFGKLFDQTDVQAICSVGETTKKLTDIGRFGIGFKSVYTFTDRPEIHSGQEDFAIEEYIRPVAIAPIAREAEETVILIPRKPSDKGFDSEILAGLKRLGPSSLLFLREIAEIEWDVEGGPSGLYLRSHPEVLGHEVRRITVIGQAEGCPDVEQPWLVFSKPVCTVEGNQAGYVEIAFSLSKGDKSGQERLRPVSRSPLVVFFPTAQETHLGFLAQGPYRTTPSRDNVPPLDAWNRHCVQQTAGLLIEALRWLAQKDLLDAGVLHCLPLDRSKFGNDTMFAPLFEAVKEAFAEEAFLPRHGGGYVPARKAKLARTQELRELFGPAQLTALLGTERELAWLSGDISQDRTPDLRKYVIEVLDIEELRPETTLLRLSAVFLEAQPDDWVLRLYEFLNGQPSLRRRVTELPLIRLQDGTHVVAHVNGQPQAFLPSSVETGFPTLCRAVCRTDESRKFLQSLGLTEPDPVDDVIRNVLPKYRQEEVEVSDDQYEVDIRRILAAFASDSKAQRDKLLSALREAAFVMAVDAGDSSRCRAKPGDLYLPTERLKELFSGVGGVFLVDDTYLCLRGEDPRKLLEACGATRHLMPVAIEPNFTWREKKGMRIGAGCESSSGNEILEDSTLRGLDTLLEALPTFTIEIQSKKAALLWEALNDVEDRCGKSAFSGIYRWHYYFQRSCPFDAAFVRQLNTFAWVPNLSGELQRPGFVVFDTLGWKPNPFLASKVRFKPPIIETLAREVGIEPGVLDLLKKHGFTSVAELAARLGLEEESDKPNDEVGPKTVDDAAKNILGDAPGQTPSAPEPLGSEPQGSGSSSGKGSSGFGHWAGSVGGGGMARDSVASNKAGENSSNRDTSAGKRTAGSAGGRPFISYVGAHAEDKERDPDDLDQPARMALEERAIMLILESEPQLQRTPTHNPGFDLMELDTEGQPMRWVEVKAMTGNLHGRPVGLSRTQFECARVKGSNYWLYIVEEAGLPEVLRIVRIQDPAGKARTFTFDHGWLSIAEIVERRIKRQESE